MRVFLLFIFMTIFSSCYFEDDNYVFKGAKRHSSLAAKAKVYQVKVENDQLVIDGAELSGVTSVKVEGDSLSESFEIESKSASQIVANGLRTFSFGMGKVFNLILADAHGAATYQVQFTLDDGSVTAAKLHDMGAGDGDVLTYNNAIQQWEPRALSSLNLVGTWDAAANSPALADGGFNTSPFKGDYYVVGTAGTTNIDGTISWSSGDWIMFNGSAWEKVANTDDVTSFNGRQGIVNAQEGDYNLDLLGDVDTVTTPPVGGDVLKFDGTNWVPGVDNSGGGGGGSSAGDTTIVADSDNDSIGEIKFATGTSTKMVLSNSGQLGVGVLSPSYLLDLSGDNTGIRYTSSDLNAASFNLTESDTGDGHMVMNSSNAAGTGKFSFQTEGVDRLFIHNSGNVGIGTSSPGAKLDVTGNIRASSQLIAGISGSGVGGDLIVSRSNSGDRVSALIWNTDTTTGNAQVHLKVGGTSGDPRIKFDTNEANWTIGMDNSDSDKFKISEATAIGTSDRIAIAAGGNVGIGATAPAGKLHAYESATPINNGASTCTLGTSTHGGTDCVCNGSLVLTDLNSDTFVDDGECVADSFVVKNGNVGIGTATPENQLALSSTNTSQNGIDILNASAGGQAWRLQSVGSAISGRVGNFEVWNATTNANALTIQPTGNIGIGTINPSRKFHVTGNSLFRTSGTNGVQITPAADTDQSIFNVTDSANMVNWLTVDANGKVIMNGGNVGIGTTSPSNLLHLNSTNRPRILVESSVAGTTSSSAATLSLKSGNAIQWDINADSTKGDDLTIAGPNDILLLQSGNVGIGTDTPQGKLHTEDYLADYVDGTVNVACPTGYTQGDLDGEVDFDDCRAIGIVAAANGNVGIGTTNPGSILDITSSGTNSAVATIQNGTATTPTVGLTLVKASLRSYFAINGNNSGNAGGIYANNITSGTQVLGWSWDATNTFFPNGNVGIGTTAPNDALDVVGDVDATGCFQTGDTTTVGGTCVSDERLKMDIRPLNGSLQKLLGLRPTTYVWRPEFADIHQKEGQETGLIAQEVEKVFPDMVVEREDGYKRVRYGISLDLNIIQAIKEFFGQFVDHRDDMKREIASVNEKLAEKDAEIAKLKAEKDAEIDALEKRLLRLENMLLNKNQQRKNW